MENFLKEHIRSKAELDEEWTCWDYSEDVNEDAESNDWLENNTSYIYKVAVLCAIDRNKCDWVHIAIGVQRHENWDMEVKGYFYFDDGENDDISAVISRAMKMLQIVHPVFQDIKVD